MNVDIRKLKRTVKREPTSLRFALLADQHRIAGDVEKAIQVCQAGLAWHPRYATGYCTLAQCHADQADLAEAKEALLDALRFAPDRLVALKQLADILKSEGDTTRALSYYRRALATDPLDASIQAEIAALSAQQPPAPAERPSIPFPSQPVPYSEVVDLPTAAAWGTWVAGLFQALVPQEDEGGAADSAIPDSATLWPGPAFEALLTLAEEATISPEAPATAFEPPASVIVETSPVEQDVIVPELAVPPPDEFTPAPELTESAPETVDETPPSPLVIEETEAESIAEPAVEPFLSHAMDDSAMMRPEEEVVPGAVEPMEVFPSFAEPEPVLDVEPSAPPAPVVPETPAVPEAVVEPERSVEPERLVEAEVPEPVEPEVSPVLTAPPVAETPEMMETLAAPEPTAPVLSTDRYLDQFFIVEGAEPPFRLESPASAAPSPAASPVAPVTFTVPAEEEVAEPPARDADAESDEPAEPESHSDVIPTATLAELYVRQGLIDRAIAVYLSLIEKDPTNLDIHNRLSELFVIKAQQPKMPAP